MESSNYKSITDSVLLERLKVSKPKLGLRQALKSDVKLICVFDKYLGCNVPDIEELSKVKDKVRVFGSSTLRKVRSVINRAHKINVISF